MNPKTVRVTYLRQIADQAAELGVDTVAWLAISDLKQDDLADASAVVAVEKFGELITRAVCLSRETGFGVLAGRRLLTATHGVLGMAAAASRSIREAMHIVERFVRIRTEAISIHTREVDGSLEVWFEPAIGLGSASNTVTEIAMVAVKNIADDILLSRSACNMVYFQFPEPPHAALARDVFGCAVRYNQKWSGLSFDISAAEELTQKYDPLVLTEAVRFCVEELNETGDNRIAGSKLEKIVLERLPPIPHLTVCARLLSTTPRTLHRRLIEEGTSYREIVESIRHRMALKLLRKGSSIKEVTYFLGYADIASFRRAFRRWEGMAPSDWSARVQEPAGESR
ncbi:TPA: AraC family transcriptional regulator [Burkholderia vietnamiensis]|nr:AraC family transcriptional regulator [Burkholderia vietnamiensis]